MSNSNLEDFLFFLLGFGYEKASSASNLIWPWLCRFYRLALAAEICQNDFEFGDIKLLTSLETDHPDAVKISPVSSIEEYSDFMIGISINISKRTLRSLFNTMVSFLIQMLGPMNF